MGRIECIKQKKVGVLYWFFWKYFYYSASKKARIEMAAIEPGKRFCRLRW